MFTVTVSFLVLSAANLQQIQFFLVAITRTFTGADLRVTRRMQNGPNGGLISTALDEYKLSGFLERNLVQRGGIVDSYSFVSMGLNDIIKTFDGHA